MKAKVATWEVDWDLVDNIEHLKDILRDMDVCFLDYPVNCVHLCDEAVREFEVEEDH